VPELPIVLGRGAVKAFGKVGYETDRKRGSPIVLRQTRPPHRRLVIPDHKEIRKGTLRALIRQAGLSVEEFIALLSGLQSR
jgi:predicted RNA binding protein YcfA (HicA-like mRNA interferase family)